MPLSTVPLSAGVLPEQAHKSMLSIISKIKNVFFFAIINLLFCLLSGFIILTDIAKATGMAGTDGWRAKKDVRE